jgi:LysM repeat protein
MEEEESTGSSGMIPLVVAIIAVVLGGVGLYLGYSAQKRVTALESGLSEGSTSAAEMERKLQQANTRLNEVATKVDTAASDLDALRTRFRILGTQTQEGLSAFGQEINANREAIAQLNQNMQEIASTTTRRATTAASAATSPATDAANSDNRRTYTIQAGDTFQRIAREHNVSVQALLDANPDADPRRLRIGTEIIIP